MKANDFYSLKSKLDIAGITLVAVSKTKSESSIRSLYDLGQRHFGENYVQELIDKHAHLPADIHWHFIGHLQRNKVKFIAPFIHLIQSVDSIKLLQEINKQALKNKRTIDVLLQVHIADEATKFGFDEAELTSIVSDLGQFPNVHVRGLMGMATFTDDAEKVGREFDGLKKIFDRLNVDGILNLDTLSMGMSADYDMAIEHGSTMVRIGSLLFGARE